MPIRYVGKEISHRGKRLYEILCKLKNYGVGRMVHRDTFSKRYEEPSYYIITRVDPDYKNPQVNIINMTSIINIRSITLSHYIS